MDFAAFNVEPAGRRLPYIPPKLWQIYLGYSSAKVAGNPIQSWMLSSPSHSYTIVDDDGAATLVSQLSKTPGYDDAQQIYDGMTRLVLRADFLRYLLLATQGGAYGDIDTEMIRPLHEWVPEEYKSKTKFIVGLESDQSPPVPNTVYEVQFCQWTLASAPGHPVLWKMLERIATRVRTRIASGNRQYTDADVLSITGPVGWTEVIYDHLSTVTGSPMTWRNLTGMMAPRLYGDTLVLPINGFATGMPHSGASPDVVGDTMVLHRLSGSWKGGVAK